MTEIEAVSKLALAENHHFPSPPMAGVLIFSDFHPLGRGKEGGENHNMMVLRQPQMSIATGEAQRNPLPMTISSHFL